MTDFWFSAFIFPSQESEGFFLRAIQINPNAASCHGNLGELLQLQPYHIFYRDFDIISTPQT